MQSKNNQLKFLIIGLGSMGKRRIRNLHFNGQKRIIGYDLRPDRRREAKEKYDIEIVVDLKKIQSSDFDAMIISTPPDRHGDYIRLALKLKKHFFVEHPTLTDGYEDIFKNKKLPIIMAPSSTMRFYRPIKMIKNILDTGKVGKILAFQYHAGQYLPDWHPYEDYRKVYFSKKATGACREIFPFEQIWLNWIFNSEVKEVRGFVGKVSDLRMKADDIMLSTVKYKNGILGTIIIDAIARQPYRTLRVLGSQGTLDWERFDSRIKLYGAKSKKTEIIAVPKGHPQTGYINEEEMYNDEIKVWLGAIRGKEEYPHNFTDSLQLLKTLYALEKGQGAGWGRYDKETLC